MTLWATAENTVGIIIANLPLLRKPLERLLSSLLPSTHTGDEYTTHRMPGGNYNSFRLQSCRSQGKHKSTTKSVKARSARLPISGDNESDEAILGGLDREEKRHGSFKGIMKTTEVTVLQGEKDEKSVKTDKGQSVTKVAGLAS